MNLTESSMNEPGLYPPPDFACPPPNSIQPFQQQPRSSSFHPSMWNWGETSCESSWDYSGQAGWQRGYPSGRANCGPKRPYSEYLWNETCVCILCQQKSNTLELLWETSLQIKREARIWTRFSALVAQSTETLGVFLFGCFCLINAFTFRPLHDPGFQLQLIYLYRYPDKTIKSPLWTLSAAYK